MDRLKSCYKRGLKSGSQIIKTPRPLLLRETQLSELQEFLKHAATAESRVIQDVPRHFTNQSLTAESVEPDRTAAAADQSDLPQLEFFLCYDAQRGVLQVHPLLISGVVSPKCRVKAILGGKMRTSEFAAQDSENTLVFRDEMLEFSQIYLLEVARLTLYLQIYTYNTLSVPSVIGSVLPLPLGNVDIYGSFFARTIDKKCNQIMEVPETSRGEVEIQLSLSTDQKTIKGTLVQANNLCKMDFWGSSDPFVKVHLFYKEKCLAKWNTSVKKNSLNPVYNESFSFDTDSKDANDLYVMLTVKDYDRIGKNDVIGYALIGEASSCESGRSQWAVMMKTLGEVTTFKHTLSL